MDMLEYGTQSRGQKCTAFWRLNKINSQRRWAAAVLLHVTQHKRKLTGSESKVQSVKQEVGIFLSGTGKGERKDANHAIQKEP